MSEYQAGVAVDPASAAVGDPVDVAAGELVPGMVPVPSEVEQAQPAAPPAAHGDHFDLVLRGYDRRQVDDYVARITIAVDQLRVDAAVAATSAAASQAELAKVQAELERGRPSFDSLGERVSQMLGLAETEAEQMRTDAGREAAQMRSDAAQEAAQVRAKARRDAEELGAAARRELAELTQHQVEMLTEIARMRDILNTVLAGAAEQWPSLAPTDGADTPEIDLTAAPNVADRTDGAD